MEVGPSMVMNASLASRILFEDPDFLVVDKPAHLLVHPTKPGGPVTLWDELKGILSFELVNGGQISLINRLDRETSGLILIAKNPGTARELNRAIERHEIRKGYLAIVYGWIGPDSFEIDQPLLRQGRVTPSRIWLKQAIHPNGSRAMTHFKVRQRFNRGREGYSLVHAEPQTGRTHQIRVHLASIGHAIVGDKIYGPDESCYLEFIETGWTTALEKKLLLPRHALHASSLAFSLGGQSYSFESALPEDLGLFIEGLPPKG